MTYPFGLLAHGNVRRCVAVCGVALPAMLFACRQAPPDPDPATVYEEYYVPALFGPWAERVVAAAQIDAGDAVLDIACGTGVVARSAAARVGPRGRVVGLDIDPAMLAVARRTAPRLEWRQGDAQALPFGDASFDVVACQFGLMFFPDKLKSIREMHRVAKPGARIVVTVWGPLAASPGYETLVGLIDRHMGRATGDLIRTPFNLGDRAALAALFARAGVQGAGITTQTGEARFPSVHSWVETEVRGWVGLSREIDERELAAVQRDAERELADFIGTDGAVATPVVAHVVTWTK